MFIWGFLFIKSLQFHENGVPIQYKRSCVIQREHTAVLYCSKIPESWCLFAGHRHFAPIHPLLSKVKVSPVHYMPTMTSLHSTLLSSPYSSSLLLTYHLNTCCLCSTK